MRIEPLLRPARSGRCIAGIVAITGVCRIAHPAAAQTAAVTVAPEAGAPAFTGNTGTTLGWEFTAEAPMLVTHLGLFDDLGNGFVQAHPVGLWDAEGGLLASVVIGPGAEDPLTDDFRYIEISPTALSAGENYVVGYFTETFMPSDFFHLFLSDVEFDAAITHVQARAAGPGIDEMVFPETTFDPTTTRVGAGFLFVPEPASIGVMILAFAVCGRRRV
jgi:hypothetical protein